MRTLRKIPCPHYLALAARGALDAGRAPNERVSEDLSSNSAFREIFLDINDDPIFSSPEVVRYVSTIASLGLAKHYVELEDWVGRDWARREGVPPNWRPGETTDPLVQMAFTDVLQDMGMATAIPEIAPYVRPLVSERYRTALEVIENRSYLHSNDMEVPPLRKLYIVDPADLEWEQILDARAGVLEADKGSCG